MKPKIIEVIGPPGVGKSTIYKALCSSWAPTDSWTHQDELLASPKPSVNQITDWLEYNFRNLLGKPKVKSIPVEYGLRFSGAYKDLANFCWDHLSGSDMPLNKEIGTRFRASYFLFSDFCRYQAIFEKVNGVPCLLEEGFLQKSFLLHDNSNTLTDTLKSYLTLIPHPHAIILIDTSDISIITRRLVNRNKVIASHLNANEKTLGRETEKWRLLLLTATNELEQNGVKVCRLDAKKSILDSVAQAREYLGNL